MSVARGLARDLARDRAALAAALALAAILALAALAPLVSPQDPHDLAGLDVMEGLLPPGSARAAGGVFLLGSDDQGRDVLSAILHGLRTSLVVGASATLIGLGIGGAVGLAAAWLGGRADAFLMRVADVQLSIPAVLVALVLLAALGKGTDKVVAALAAAQWAYHARTVRGAALVELGKDYVEAARCLALSPARIALRHVLPNCLPPVAVVAAVQAAHAVSLEATLSFLGVGVPVTEPSLGMLIANGSRFMLSGQYWVGVFPGLALVAAILSINLVADRLRDALDPRLVR